MRTRGSENVQALRGKCWVKVKRKYRHPQMETACGSILRRGAVGSSQKLNLQKESVSFREGASDS